MNLKKTFIGTLALAATMLVGACGDDEATSLKEQFAFEGESLSLKDANIFLVYDGGFDNRGEKDFLITDGTYDAGEDEFTGSTYFIEVYLVTEEGADDFEKGKYPQWSSWGDNVPATSKIGYIEAYAAEDDINYFEFQTPEGEEDGDPVEASGGFDDGETITLKLSGNLDYYHYDAEEDEWITETSEGKFAVKGKIEDLTSSGPARKHSRIKQQL